MPIHGYTISQAARLLNVSRPTMYRLIKQGRIVTIKTLTRHVIPHQELVNIQMGIQ